MRLDLPDGQWADLRERLTYGQAKPIKSLASRYETGKEYGLLPDLYMALVTAYVSAWNVLDPDGNAVPLDQPETAPDDIIQEIGEKAQLLWKAARHLPKGGKRSSATRRPELRSA